MKTQTINTQLWNTDLIKRYDITGPRYTSYPTAPHFSAEFSALDWQNAMTRSNASQVPLSLYFHIPFCDTVCYYCGCNKIITANKSHAEPYLKALHKEVTMQAKHCDTSRPVNQLHFGGGTPTYISDGQIESLMSHIANHFTLTEDDEAEYCIEIHPQTVTAERLAKLRTLKFNRLSLGVQDFDPVVQKAVNRFNTFEEVQSLISAARALNYKAISLDLIYGLPHQTCETFKETLSRVIELRPDRLSLFNYAHMPELFKVQRQIDASALPEPQEKLQMLQNSIEQLGKAGYIYIGMDHFALPDDELASLQAMGKLHRNFQGYATHGNCDLLAFGVSAINSLNNCFIQNHKSIEPYIHAINKNALPIAKGIALSNDDLIRRRVINELICHFTLNYADIETDFDINFLSYFESEISQLEPFILDELIQKTHGGIAVRDAGRLLIRRICMVFDKYIQQRSNDSSSRYSRII